MRESSISGTVRASTQTITIRDTSQAPTYSISPDVTSVNEGGAVSWKVTTTSVPNGTVLYWVAGGVTAADFVGGETSGSVTINSNSGRFSKSLKSDLDTEGNENITMVIKTGSTSGDTVATSPTVSVVDTSQDVPTYAIAPNVTSVNEGSSVVFTVIETVPLQVTGFVPTILPTVPATNGPISP